MASWAGCNADELPPAAAQLAAECGYLPFALAINGAMVRRGTPWQDLLDAFDEHELEFARAHERLANYPYRDVFRAIRPSIVELSAVSRRRRNGWSNSPPSTGRRACPSPP